MAAAHETSEQAEPVERFHPTSGLVTGIGTLVAVGVIVAYLVATERTLTGLRLGAGLIFFGVLVWLTVVRPRVTAYRDELKIHNTVRDVLIPYAAIDDVTLGRVLSVWVGDRRHVCTGIGAPRFRGKGRPTLLGAPTESAAGPHPASEIGYAPFVRNRILALAEEARRRSGDTPPGAPRHVWAWPEVIALAGTGAVFALTLLL